MSSWKDPDRWQALLEGRDCPLCDRGSRPGVVAELASCFVAADASVQVRGYCCLILKRHVVELHLLSAAEAARFVHDTQIVAAAVQELTGAIKLNYEIHGNVVPHLHLHIVPRYPSDAIELTGKPFATLVDKVWDDGEFPEFTGQLRQRLTPI